MDRNITQLSTEDDAIRAAAGVLADCGYTRNTDPRDIDVRDYGDAVSAFLFRLVVRQDIGFLVEFLVEHSDETMRQMFRAIAADQAEASPVTGQDVSRRIHDAVGEYAEPWIVKALAELPSASEIERDRKIDQDIKAMKEGAL